MFCMVWIIGAAVPGESILPTPQDDSFQFSFFRNSEEKTTLNYADDGQHLTRQYPEQQNVTEPQFTQNVTEPVEQSPQNSVYIPLLPDDLFSPDGGHPAANGAMPDMSPLRYAK